MEETPTSRPIRQRHTPTPKMSERKRALFASSRHLSTRTPSTIDEDCDLGPMSPLQFSCSPSTNDTVKTRHFMHEPDARTDFKNIMLTLSPLRSNQTTNRTTPTKSGSTPVKHAAAGVAQYEPVRDDSSQSRSSDMFRLEKENLIESAQKTPSTVDVGPTAEFPRISFRKSLIFDTGMTPTDGQYSTKTSAYKRNASADNADTTSDTPKARTSLSFGDKPQISAKTFYGSSFQSSLPTTRKSAPLASRPTVVKPLPSATKRSRQSHTKKTQRKSSGPFLGSSSVCHKIHKPKVVQAKTKALDRFQIIESAMELIGARVANKTQFKGQHGGQSGPLDEYKITKEQIEKLHKILHDQPSSGALSTLSSKPLNWTGSRTTLNSSGSSDAANNDGNDTTFGQTSMMNTSGVSSASSCPDDGDAVPEVEVERQPEPHRKFFKSRTPSTTNNYTVMKGIKATVKRGSGGVTLLMAPKSKKAKREHSDYEELKDIRREVTDIINMLTNSDDDPDPASVATASTALIDPQTDYPTIPLADTCIANANDSAAQSLLDELTESQRNYQRFARLLPFNTTDPEVQQRQETLLSLLFTNNICTEQNFKIFIAEPDAHEAEASRILEDLYVLNVHDDMDTSVDSMSGQADGFNDDDDVPMSPASQISTMTLGLVLDSPSTTSEVVAVEPPEDMFPIFQKASNCIEPTTLRDNSCSSKPIKWKPIGDKQYQLDAGQKQFGGKMCSCGMFYAVHEPEDEALHQKYHDIYAQLAFKGWLEERIVCSVPEWGVEGRIICVTDVDTKVKRQRSAEMVSLVDRELGYADIPTKPQSIIYLAVAKRQVVGVCVAEPLQLAHPLANKSDGVEMVDLTTTVTVKCGISRIWVAAPHRRQGIAMRLFTAMRSHFIRGYTLRLSEVAFSSPTELGRLFAGYASSKVLVY